MKDAVFSPVNSCIEQQDKPSQHFQAILNSIRGGRKQSVLYRDNTIDEIYIIPLTSVST